MTVPMLHDTVPAAPAADMQTAAAARRDQEDMMKELRLVKGLIEERFGALAFMEKLQRQPAQARLTQKLLDCGFSPALIRKLADAMPHEVNDESSWAASVLERNLVTGEADGALEDQGGVYALVGATGVGKTFAYLVPALLSGERVLLSTATKTLQDQLFLRDLPRLRDALQLPVSIALLKGRSSYLCLHRMKQARHSATLPDRWAVRTLAKV